ncbi:hypothetical protein CANCADRAFT_87625 [Tortispora caseinolytica NRRL Y-17796]|uniref:Phosphoglycerate mutase-like protein n=1 Tax=Tortispora caseinolytica NRRL Y-17796 TaxID=767744 RepID=A0A1E4TL83_9ASCO|nr:hypothetical protein CANCADRAFT_87625 [Tortispora caseinolytica NRRL Y-17796]
MVRPRLIVLVRHGESEGNVDKKVNRVVPNHRIPLTKRGKQQAHASGRELAKRLRKTDSIMMYTSPYLRARQTAQSLAAELTDFPLTIFEEPRLREQDFGNFQFPKKEMDRIKDERASYGHFFYRIPNGESAADVYDRVAGLNEALFRQFLSDNFPDVLVLVTHGIMARVFLMKWFRWSVERFESLRNIQHCELLVMERQHSPQYMLSNRLLSWNDNLADLTNEEKDAAEFDIILRRTFKKAVWSRRRVALSRPHSVLLL